MKKLKKNESLHAKSSTMHYNKLYMRRDREQDRDRLQKAKIDLIKM